MIIIKDCGKCPYKEDRFFTFEDGDIRVYFYCNFYNKICKDALEECKKLYLDDRKDIKIEWIGRDGV